MGIVFLVILLGILTFGAISTAAHETSDVNKEDI